jgi:hypothetical protein
MAEPAPNPELLPSLRRLVRGLSVLFWGLPFALLSCAHVATWEWLRAAGVVPAIAGTGMLFYGLGEMGRFQRQERVWQQALERARIAAFINFGLSPFVFWYNKMSSEVTFQFAVGLLALSGIVFLFNLNLVLQRLAAMLPDETLRADTRLFTALNLGVLLGVVAMAALYFALREVDALPPSVAGVLELVREARGAVALGFVLPPVALTMSLLWKLKETVVASVYQPPPP